MPRKHSLTTRHPAPSGRPRALRVGAVATAPAMVLLWPRTPTTTAAQHVTIDMGGFHPASIIAKAGATTRIQVIDPDSSMHSDGGGWHQLAIPELQLHHRGQLTFGLGLGAVALGLLLLVTL